MSDSPSIWQSVAAILRLYVSPVQIAAARGPESVVDLVKSATGGEDAAVISAVTTLATDTKAIVSMNPADARSPEKVKEVASSVLKAWDKLSGAVPAATLTALVDYLAARFLITAWPRVYSGLALLSVVDESRPPDQRFIWDNLKYLWHPRDLLPDVYKWNTTEFRSEVLIRRAGNALGGLGAPVTLTVLSDAEHAALDSNPIPADETR